MFELRPMQQEDIGQLARWVLDLPLWQRYQLTEAKLFAQLEAAIEQKDIVLVLTEKRYPCAFLWCQPKAVFGRSSYLKLIGVAPSFQGQGLGLLLLNELELQVSKISQDIFLLVSDFNEAAQRFYLRQGFEKIGAIPAYVLPDVTEFIFRKHLAK